MFVGKALMSIGNSQVLESDQIKSATVESLRFMNNKIKIIDNNMFG